MESKTATKDIMLSAIQPSSTSPHLGNYLGAIQRWVNLQDEYSCYFFLVDLHSITVRQDPKELRQNTYAMLAYYMASGLDPKKSLLFCQSHISEHAELAWILGCLSYMGELGRMTQYKDKSKKQGENIGSGLFMYPVLMAADILLYQPKYVPVGDDQKQHIELTRNLAQRFNHTYSTDLFRMPEPMIGSVGARIMDLQEPTSKMSKSTQNQNGVLYLSDDDKTLTKKIKSAMTDSGSEIVYSDDKPGIKNLINIYSALTEKTPIEIVHDYQGKMYGHLKGDLAEIVVQKLSPIRNQAQEYLRDLGYLDRIFQEAAAKARTRAKETLAQVYELTGFIGN